MAHPLIIQGGMGVAVSGWPLANAVARLGQLGTVSGTALGAILARRLQMGDPGGHLQRALSNFPFPAMADRILKTFLIPGGKAPNAPFKTNPPPMLNADRASLELTITANFAEVYLAKEGHSGVVGINYLEKIQLPTLPSLFGAMLAGVDYILMGAGIPRAIPGILDSFAEGKPASLLIDVIGALPGEQFIDTFNPAEFCGAPPPKMTRPFFLGIVSSDILAATLAKKSSGRIDGFVVEGETAGGHNAPPRGTLQLSDTGEPLYGPRDRPNIARMRDLGLPFWLAGSYGRPEQLREALSLGATGVQVGTAFAFCEESGITPEIKREVIRLSRAGDTRVFTDPLASPTGFPFKVVELKGTLSEESAYQQRRRVCDLGYLRHLYRRDDGAVGYRCPSEPVAEYVRKGGEEAHTHGRKCICNCLPATVGLPQVRKKSDGTISYELPLLTAGNDAANVKDFLPEGSDTYSVADVIRRLRGNL
jgi:nitronate monooxygenase